MSSPTPDAIHQTLATLHAKKSAVYGDAWRKRGEVLSIFPNVARKYDRLEVAVACGELDRAPDDPPADTVEPLFDTVADLVVYAVKYLMFLAETEPDTFPGDRKAFVAFESGLTAVASNAKADAADLRGAFARLSVAMEALEHLLLGVSTTAQREDRARTVVVLAGGSWELLAGTAMRWPAGWDSFAFAVIAL